MLERECSDEEKTTTLQLLIDYAATESGAVHLSKCSILATLFKSNVMQRLDKEDLYVTRQVKSSTGQQSQQQVRNAAHVHWCQTLVLIRTLNEWLLENPAVHHQQYFADLLRQLHHYRQRIPQVLHLGLSLEASRNQQRD